jgi:hypothetical protein
MTVGGAPDGGAPDVVYVVRDHDNNEELRFSLRSLVNVPHGRVWLAGGQPSWTTNVQRLPVRQEFDKYRNIQANLAAAADCEDLTEEFLYFNDDFFVMQPVDQIGYTHRGPWPQALRGYTQRRDRYAQKLRAAAKAWPDGLCYDSTHRPMPMEKGRLRDVLDGPLTLWKSDYGNMHQVGGVYVKDVKMKRAGKPPADATFLSTSDASFKHHQVGRTIRARFREPSPYELQ